MYRERKPLPVYTAAKVLIEQLNGYSFVKRIDTGNPLDFVFQYKHPSEGVKLVVWTAPPPMESPDKTIPHHVSIPIEKDGDYELFDIYGISKKINGRKKELNVHIHGAPQYIKLR